MMDNIDAIIAMQEGLKMRNPDWPAHQYYTISKYNILYDEHGVIIDSNAVSYLEKHDYGSMWEIYRSDQPKLEAADMSMLSYDDYVKSLENGNRRLREELENAEKDANHWWELSKIQAGQLASTYKNSIWVFCAILVFLFAITYMLNTTIAVRYQEHLKQQKTIKTKPVCLLEKETIYKTGDFRGYERCIT